MLSGAEWFYAAAFITAPVAIRYAFTCVRDIAITFMALRDAPSAERPNIIRALAAYAGAMHRRPDPASVQLAIPTDPPLSGQAARTDDAEISPP
ncbi:hypothetical protein [Actinomadura fibrosa]|uniref:Uncharacterized protein n=1 Tax=Actinomadura fibrosa TaxID=111802 RepID=A0ABW2XCC4_9ACTN|nr:hypothetical protein [Actinomadura fibrosa]